MDRDRPALENTASAPNAVEMMRRPAPLRVLVIARQPVTRAGLRALFTDRDDIHIVGQIGTVEGAEDLAHEVGVETILAATSPSNPSEAATLLDFANRVGLPLVLLIDTPLPGAPRTLLGTGGRGLLLPDATAEEVGAALTAVSQGLVVLAPVFSTTFAPTTAALPDDALVAAESLSEREREVLRLLALGLPNKTIATRLSISEHTVKFHVGSILAKLNATSRTEAVTRAVRLGLLAL